ncbi:MAG: VanZ family protein, partial [Patescibacteria group bacterium]
MQLKKFLFLWLPVLAWAGLIFYLSSIPNLAVGEGEIDFLTRKPAHIAEYAVLFILIFRALRGSIAGSVKKLYFPAAVFT